MGAPCSLWPVLSRVFKKPEQEGLSILEIFKKSKTESYLIPTSSKNQNWRFFDFQLCQKIANMGY
jgi:hypothetical protein